MSVTDDFTDVVNAALARSAAYRQQAASLLPEQASAMSSVADTWPQLNPGLVLPLGKAGLTGDHPVVQQAAAQAVKQQAAKGGVAKTGQQVTGQSLKKASGHKGILGSIGSFLSDLNPLNAGQTLTKEAVNHPAIGNVVAKAGQPIAAAGAAITSNPAVKGVYTGLKAGTRVGTAALELPADLIQEAYRGMNLFYNPVGAAASGATPNWNDLIKQTQIGALIEAGVTHGDTGGSGFFFNPKSEAGKEQSQAAREFAGTINGHALTVGRGTAAVVTEPGTERYSILSGLLDAGVQLEGGKPVSDLGKAVRGRNVLAGGEAEYVVNAEGKTVPAAEATQQAQATRDTVNSLGMPAQTSQAAAASYGLVDGLRKTVLPEKAVTWLNSNAGNRFAQFAADSNSFNDIWDTTGRKLPVDVVNKLVDAANPVEVKRILADELGTTLREAPTVSSAQATVAAGGTPGIIGQAGLKVRRLKQSPLLTLMPHQSLDLTNPDQAVTDLDRFQRITKAFTEDEISKNNEKLARALTGPGGEGAAFQAIGHVMDVVGDTLKKHGMPAADANRAVRMWKNTIQDLRHYNVNDIGDNVDFPGVQIGDDGLPAPSPHLFVEYLNNHVPLPNIRDIRTAVSSVARITNSAPARFVQRTSDYINNNIFKPWALLRGAWPVRVIGEEQMRMGAAGYSSMVNGPVSYLALLAGSKMPRTTALLQKMGKDALTSDITGTKWADLADEAFTGDANEFAQAMSKRGGGYIDPSNGIITRHYPIFTKGVDPDFHLAWADELRKLNTDPVASRVAKAMDESGTGAPTIPQALNRITDWLWDGEGHGVRNSLAARWDAAKTRRLEATNNNPFLDRQQTQNYVESVYNRIVTKTGGHPQLVNAAATGRIMGVNLVKGGEANPKAAQALTEFTDYAPQKVTGPLRVYGANSSPGQELGAMYKKFINASFDLLMTKPTNALSRSPVFKQAYYQRISELAPYMESKAAAKAAKGADQAGARDTAEALRAGGKGKLTVDDADTIAKKYALDQVQELLYGESKRSSFFDAYRILFPFGDAYREVLTRWAKLVSQNPAVPLRAAQITNGARQAGFTYTDPQTGKETFVYPGTEQVTQLVTGVPVKFTGQASGLNMVTAQMLPGFGPVVQIAAGELLPNIPATQGLRDFLMPYGPGDTSGGVFDQLSSVFLPAWLKKLQATSRFATPEQKRQLMATTNQVAASLYSTGKYDISTPDGQQKLISDARSKAKTVWMLRGMAQFGAPAAPEPEISAADKNGQLHTLYALGTAYRDIAAKDPTNATLDFMNTYGPLALMATNPTSDGTFSPTTSLYDFATANPDLVKKYPTLYGYFAPAGGQYSNKEFQRQIANGERVGVTPQQNLDITNQRMATAVYNQLKSEVAGRTDQAAQQWLSQARDKLAAMYPQFGAGSSTDSGTIAQQIQKLTTAVKDPEVATTDAGKGLALYMQARQKALDAAKSSGLASFATAKSAANIRTWLRGVATQIVATYPDFQTLYTDVLSHEMTNDDTGGQ